MSRFSVSNDTDQIEKETENKASSSSGTASIAESTDDKSASDEAVTDTEEIGGSETETETETTAEVKEPKPDPADADNTWAMFLVNSQNPVPDKYCEGIERELVYESWREYYMDARMAEYMKQMLKAAAEDGHQLVIMSAYRTIDYQQRNFDNSVQDRITNLGMTEEEAYEDTLKEVQLPGYSEHNAGLAADIMVKECTDMDSDAFKNTDAYAWLMENAADYGFILRYPEGKEDVTGIIYEPWHYRFVGVYYAKQLADMGITMEEYFEEMNWVDENGKSVSHLPVLE